MSDIKSRKYKLLVFDWDGTLYDSAAFVVACVKEAAEKIHITPPPPETTRQMMGLNYEEALRRSFPHLSPMQQCELAKTYRDCAHAPKALEPCLFEGAREVLLELRQRGYWLAIATGKSRLGLDRDLKYLNLDELFIASRCADETASKPNPQMLEELMDVLNVTPLQTLMIGDTEYDMQLALNADVDALGVSYGAHAAYQLEGSHVRGILQNIQELPIWLEQHDA